MGNGCCRTTPPGWPQEGARTLQQWRHLQLTAHPSQPRSANLASALALVQYTIRTHCLLSRQIPPAQPSSCCHVNYAYRQPITRLSPAAGQWRPSTIPGHAWHSPQRHPSTPEQTPHNHLGWIALSFACHSPAIRLPSVTLTGNHFRCYLPHLLDLALPMCNY